MSEHLGYEKHDPAGRGRGNSRNGTRAKTVLTEIGPVEIEVPLDTELAFERRSSASASGGSPGLMRSCCR
jgi:transposase-like protein